jgi:hypothetical protein
VKADCSLFITHQALFIAHYSLLIAHYASLITFVVLRGRRTFAGRRRMIATGEELLRGRRQDNRR